MYPSVFSAATGPETAPPRLLGLASALADDPDCSDLLPPFPVLGHAAFLLRDLPPPTPWSPVPAKSCSSPAAVSSVFSEFRDPAPSPATPDAAAADELGELDFDDDGGFDADSFLGVDEAAAEGIDAIMGKLTMGNDAAATAATSANSYLPGSSLQSYLRNVMMLQLGFRHGQLNKSQAQALKGQTVDTKWWMCPAIPVKDIVPAQQASAQMPVVPENKKKSKKKVEREMNIATGVCRKAEEGVPGSANGDPRTLVLPETGLGLRLNREEVLKAWCGRGSVFADPDLPRSSAADVLGRFVSKAYLLQQAAEKEKEG
ncbi:hypothetical protein PR202_gb28323 [Eleusine coracana subsp. coracana]|uniref:Uncharacterized protein n=1 Tax=Eleusine coracana subsp. coracana TaxID=191504 RepID=A0AAV5FU88_ELECO|nr:hypothetical protein PR202_gb28323 [Eleusine coracana subsp. coracana]